MSPSHTLKAGKRYLYYVSNEPGTEQSAIPMRLPASTLEASILPSLRGAIGESNPYLSPQGPARSPPFLQASRPLAPVAVFGRRTNPLRGKGSRGEVSASSHALPLD